MKRQKNIKAFVISSNDRLGTKGLLENIKNNGQGQGIGSENLDAMCTEIIHQIKKAEKR